VDDALSAWGEIRSGFRDGAILLGNGASRAFWSEFGYASLFAKAESAVEHPLNEQDGELFARLDTTNFEAVLSALRTAEIVASALELDAVRIRERYESIRIALMEAVKDVHVPWLDVPSKSLLSVRSELTNYSIVFSTNYDLLLYWTIMATPSASPFKDFFWNECTDGGDWRCFDLANTETVWGSTSVFYLHGALHLVELPWGETAKLTAGQASLLEQFAVPETEDEFPIVPLVITEGSSSDKMKAIRRNDYLSFAYESLSHFDGPFVVFGHSLGPEDQHLIDALKRGSDDRPIALSLLPAQTELVEERKLELKRTLPRARLAFFDATTHPLGAKDLLVG
jgi:hypothetical protein